MNRKKGPIFVIIFILLFFSFYIFSELTYKDPLKREFYGIVSECKRMYPSKVKFKFINQEKTYYISHDYLNFKNSVSVGDSIAKVKDDNFLTLYKREGGRFSFYEKFYYK